MATNITGYPQINSNPREAQNVTITNITADNKVALDVAIKEGAVSGSFTPSGLSNAIKTQSVTVTDVAAPIPGTVLVGRNSVGFRNMGPSIVYFGDSSVTVGGGWPKFVDEEFHVDITDDTNVQVYAVCDTGQTSEVRIIEVA